MTLNPGALALFVAVLTLVAIAASSGGGAWFYLGEAAAGVVILAGVAGLLTRHGSQQG